MELLKEPNWLNDGIVGFYFEYIKEHLFKDYKQLVGFECPETAHFLKFAESQEKEGIVTNLELRNKNLIMIPLNDSMDKMTTEGSHWSFMAFEASKKTSTHYDSVMGSRNIGIAEKTS